MSDQLKTGDRVRVVTDAFRPYIEPGDRGTVRGGPDLIAGEVRSYVVALDKDVAASDKGVADILGHVFLASSIEPDL